MDDNDRVQKRAREKDGVETEFVGQWLGDQISGAQI